MTLEDDLARVAALEAERVVWMTRYGEYMKAANAATGRHNDIIDEQALRIPQDMRSTGARQHYKQVAEAHAETARECREAALNLEAEIAQNLDVILDQMRTIAGQNNFQKQVADRIATLADEVEKLRRRVAGLEAAGESLPGEVRRMATILDDLKLRLAGSGPEPPVRRVEADDIGTEEPVASDDLPERLSVVMFASEPDDRPRIDLQEEIRLIQQQLTSSRLGESVDFYPSPAARIDDLFTVLNRRVPQLLQISAHGDPEGVALRTARGRTSVIPASAFLEVVLSTAEGLSVVYFNMCDSAQLARDAARHVDVAIGMAGDVRAAAHIFSSRLYGAIASGRSVGNAFRQACAALRAHDVPEYEAPQLFVRDGVDPARLVLVRSGKPGARP